MRRLGCKEAKVLQTDNFNALNVQPDTGKRYQLELT